MADLPSGTVTFLFTDIEGSTRLLSELGAEGYADALAAHRRLVRQAVERHDGAEVDTEGDAFFVAFARAGDAAAAARSAQELLGVGPISVRMGLHTGEPLLVSNDYVGMDVHRAARICAAAHGGQIVLSQATRELLDDRGDLHDLGEHRLKDMAAPQRLWQLGDGAFPALRTLAATSLPVQPTPLVGRERELAEAGDLLRAHRLLTLTGPGGTGKTRLALQLAADAADEFDGGVHWIPLSPLRDPALVESAIAQAVGAKNGLVEHLGSKRALLLLDNFEHVVEAGPRVAELLGAASEVKALVTSREPLHVALEQRYSVPTLEDAEALTLFVERARRARPDFEPSESVAEICRRLDGLPLALELAAARVTVLEPAALLARLEQRLPMLTGGLRDAPERHRALRATIAWSHELLDEDERRLFARLGVFRGGFDLEAAEAICGADVDTLQALVEKSLVRERDGRFFMLETIREFAAERLADSGELDRLGERHASHYLCLVEALVPDLEVVDDDVVAALDRERDNVRAALEVFGSIPGDRRLADLVARLWVYWYYRGLLSEGLAWLYRANDAASAAGPERRASVLAGLSNLSLRKGDVASARAWAEAELATARDAGLDGALPLALRDLGNAYYLEDPARAVELYESSAEAAQLVGDRTGEAAAIANVANVELMRGNFDRALELCDRVLPLMEGSDAQGRATPLFNRAFALLELGRLTEAEEGFAVTLTLAAELGWPEGIFYPLEAFGFVAARAGNPVRAARLLAAADAFRAASSVYREPLQQHARDRALVIVREALEPPAFEAEWARGAAMEVDEAVEYALAGGGR